MSGERVVGARVARQVLSVMATCGMYDAAGDWLSVVGIPAKSGVAGGILGALPGEVGIGTFSPRLDRFGNSTRGVRVCERLSEDMGLHLMGMPPAGLAVVREVEQVRRDGRTTWRAVLQGPVTFSGGERVLRELARVGVDGVEVVLDLTRVSHVDDVGRRMLLEGVRRLSLDGHGVTVADPAQMLGIVDEGTSSPVR